MKSNFFVLFCLIILAFKPLIGQEDCGTAAPIPIATIFGGDNTGSLADNDYSAVTGCPSQDYASSVWYSFTTPAGTTSLNFTFTSLGLGTESTITIVDDCTTNASYSYIWWECMPIAISGTARSLCGLTPNTTYFIQVASNMFNEGPFNIDLQLNPVMAPNDICATATDLGVLPCLAGMSWILNDNPAACPDYLTGVGCVQPSDPGVWYSFSTNPSSQWSAITFNPLGAEFVLFSGDCNNLQYEWDCSQGPFWPHPSPNTTYYVFVVTETWLNPFSSIHITSCASPLNDLNTGTGFGGTDWSINSCTPAAPEMPCQNANAVWWSYTVGCSTADITISIDPWWPINSTQTTLAAIETGIALLETDCTTLFSQYDVNGTGFVCSAMMNNEEIVLDDVPPGTQFNIAVGSDPFLNGYFELTVNEMPSGAMGIAHDNCPDALDIFVGPNLNLHNNCSNPDVPFSGCFPSGESTVWFEFDPMGVPVDLTINISPTSIINPALALFNFCSGTSLAESCNGNSIELSCVDQVVLLEVGSTENNQGQFDLTVITAPAMSPPPINIAPTTICSGDNTNLNISLSMGVTGDITIGISPTSSPNIIGMQSVSYTNVNTVNLSDILINCGTTDQNAVYTISSSIPGFSCPSMTNDIIVTVHPKMEAIPPTIDACLPHLLTLDANAIVSGGTAPYLTYNWLWNGTQNIGASQDLMNYALTVDGFILLQVTDANGCFIETQVDVITHPLIFPIITATDIVACQGSPDIININFDPTSIDGNIVMSNWTITDVNGLLVSPGASTLTSYQIATSNTPSGTYNFTLMVENNFGCTGISNTVSITIHPTPQGHLEVTYGANCDAIITTHFYGLGGVDIYNNGPDSNGDGIPDAFDLNNDGIIDFTQFTWMTPSGDVVNSSLTFTPTETGFYSLEILTNFNCLGMITGTNAVFNPPVPPVIIEPPFICNDSEITVSCDPAIYSDYLWLDQNGQVLGQGSPSVTFGTDSVLVINLSVTDAGGCMYNASNSLITYPNPFIILSGSLTICPGDNTIVTAVGDPTNLTYVWLDQNNTVLGSDSMSLVIDTPGDYTSIVSNQYNCSDTLTFTVDENAQLNIQISGSNLCIGDSTTLDAGSGFDTYNWLDETGSVLGVDQFLTVFDQGCYAVEVTKDQCNGIDTIDIQIFTPPTIDLIPSLDICNLNNSGGVTAIDFNLLTQNSDPGDWISLDLPVTILTDLSSVGFANEMLGSYRFVFQTNNATAPCVDLSDTITINVLNCDCPFVDTNEQLVLCNSTVFYNLDLELNISSDSGNWSFLGGPENLVISTANSIDVLNISAGNYQFAYTLDPAPMPPCVLADTLDIEIVAAPIVSFDDPVIICNAISTIAPTIIDLYDYLISGNGSWIDPMILGLDFSDPSSLDFTTIMPDSYTVSFVTNDALNPCSNVTQTLNLNVLDCTCPLIGLDPIPDFCNDMALIDLDLYLGISAPGIWSADPTNPSMNVISGSDLNLTQQIPGIYSFIYTLTDPAPGCPSIDTATLNLIPAPSITDLRDTVVCNQTIGMMGTTINLNDQINAQSGSWTDQNNNLIADPPIVEFNGSTIGETFKFYFNTDFAMAPCMDTVDSLNITIIDCSCEDPVFLDPPVLCNGANMSVDLNDLITSNHQGVWTIIDQPAGSNHSLAGSSLLSEGISSGIYTLSLILDQVQPNCQENWTLEVTVIGEETATLVPNIQICENETDPNLTSISMTDLILTGSQNGVWLDSDNQIIGPEPLDFSQKEIGIYDFNYLVANESPCNDQLIPFQVELEFCAEDTFIYVPNIFSPNDDQLNDKFFLNSNRDITILEFSVYDRWGERVFFIEDILSNDPTVGWDGKFKNRSVVSGVYVYLIKTAESFNGSQIIAGDLTVTN